MLPVPPPPHPPRPPLLTASPVVAGVVWGARKSALGAALPRGSALRPPLRSLLATLAALAGCGKWSPAAASLRASHCVSRLLTPRWPCGCAEFRVRWLKPRSPEWSPPLLLPL